MFAKEVFVNYYNFYPIWLQNASFHVKKSTGTRVKKGNCQGMELEPQFGFAAPCSRSRSQKKYFSAP